jgi:hypothetical protein
VWRRVARMRARTIIDCDGRWIARIKMALANQLRRFAQKTGFGERR